MATTGGDRLIRLWDVATGKQTAAFKGHTDWTRAVVFSPDGSLLVSGDESGGIKVWDVATGKETAMLVGHKAMITGLRVSTAAKLLASSSNDGTIRFWEIPAVKNK